MSPRAILYLAMVAMLMPIVAAARYGFRQSPARWWLVVWCVVLFVTDLAQIAVTKASGASLWTQYIITPVEDVIVLLMLSNWQRGDVARLTFRVIAPIFLVAWVLLVLMFERTDNFSVFAHPFQALVMLAATLFTLARGALEETGQVTSRDWFWVTLGLSLFFAPGTALQPFAHEVYPVRPDLVLLAFYGKAAIDVVAFILIARGMRCPPTRMPSGGSLPRRLWPPASSSSRSASPW